MNFKNFYKISLLLIAIVTCSISCSSNGDEQKLTVSETKGQSSDMTLRGKPISSIYPSYNTSPLAPNAVGMSNNAVPLVAKLGLGLNIGNTFEAPGGETGWGSPVITEAYIQFVKAQGFNAIRIPCAWDFHMADANKARIDPVWLNRVKEVVGYCVANDMYVFLNIHWDGGWLDSNCTLVRKNAVNAKVKAVWEQVATTMRDYDEHLMFASANEPVTPTATEMGVLISYHQTFINAVRSTGGHNTYRCLILQGDSALIGPDNFPTDTTPNRLVFEEHNYTPYQFTLMNGDASWGNMFYYWGAGNHSTIEPLRNPNWGEESEQIKAFDHLKTTFIDRGIPVLLGEYGAYRREGSSNVPLDLVKHDASVDYWITYTTKTAMERGVKPFFWDTGGLIDRQNLIVKDQRSLNAIIAGKI